MNERKLRLLKEELEKEAAIVTGKRRGYPRLKSISPPVCRYLPKQKLSSLAASEPDGHGDEWLVRTDATRFPARPTSLAHLRRRLNKGYVLRKKGKPGPTPARAEKRTAARFYQLKSGHALTGVYLKSTDNRPDDHC